MLDSIPDKIKELGLGCLGAILAPVVWALSFALIIFAFQWWYITLSLIIIGFVYFKYKVQIKHIWSILDKSKLTYPVISVMLLGCLCDMPYEYYEYYTIVRLVSMGMFAYWAYNYSQIKEEKFSFMFGTLALLFQPFAEVELSENTWNWVDAIVAIFILILWYKKEAFIKTENNTNP